MTFEGRITDFDVIIIGARPTGLTSTLIVAQMEDFLHGWYRAVWRVADLSAAFDYFNAFPLSSPGPRATADTVTRLQLLLISWIAPPNLSRTCTTTQPPSRATRMLPFSTLATFDSTDVRV